MSDTLFDLTPAGDIASPRPPAPMWPCGAHELWHGDRDHIQECWALTCRDCGHRADDVEEFLAEHGSPAGYRSGYCYLQRHAWERVAECIECHSWWFSGRGCHNRACSLFVDDESWAAQHEWERWFA